MTDDACTRRWQYKQQLLATKASARCVPMFRACMHACFYKGTLLVESKEAVHVPVLAAEFVRCSLPGPVQNDFELKGRKEDAWTWWTVSTARLYQRTYVHVQQRQLAMHLNSQVQIKRVDMNASRAAAIKIKEYDQIIRFR